jgi:putative ABC transport system permease protein
MFKNYLQIALKVFLKNRVYSFINIIGLTMGLCACMVVATVVIDDMSYDGQWSRTNDLYRIVTVNKMGEGLYDRFASSFAGLAPALKKNYSEVETHAQLYTSALRLKFSEEESNGTEISVLNADTSFWKMLDIKPVSGNPKQYISGTNNLVISENFRDKFFPGQNPVGKIIYDVPSYEEKPGAYLITGVIKNIPSNTHLRADVIHLHEVRTEALNTEQYGTFSQNYVLLKPGTNMQQFGKKINKWYKDFVKVDNAYQFEFQPMKDIYLHSDFARYQPVKGNIQNIYIFSGVSLLLLLIACVNFINLSTARATARLKETGVRKILGASRFHIILQFLTEAILFFIFSSILAIILYQLSLKSVENYLGHPLAETFLSRTTLLISACGIILLVSFFTGIYPSWLMSGFKPAGSLKGKLFSGGSHGQNWLRKSLVVLQFTISIVVLLAMIVVREQITFMDNKDIGFNKNNLLSIGAVSWDGKASAFKNELLRIKDVEQASFSSWLPANGAGYMSREVDDPNRPKNKIIVWYIAGDANLAQTLGLHLSSGRLLSTDYSADVVNEDSLMQGDTKIYNQLTENRSCIITAGTARILQVNTLNSRLNNVKVVPVGIVEDFHNESLHKLLGPTIIIATRSQQYGGMLVRTKPGADKQVTASIQKLWKQFYPEKLLDTKWVDDMLAKQYEVEKKLQQLFIFFSTLTMLLAALGVFGLIIHAAAQRVKEIGVRKVLGASVQSIVQLLSADFIKLVLVAFAIASPFALWLMNKWLEDFAYRVTISWWMFAAAGSIAILIALLTVSYQALKAAVANPVKSLRTE